ncbi:MAG: TIGR02757 family protein [Bacteroidales bacterium]|nr:TIGR02757 family protein [Bacteroidales bacterium]
MTSDTRQKLIDWAAEYNDPVYFVEDPIAFPREFLIRGASLRDIEIAAVFAAHFAWGRRSMIVRDLERFFDRLEWKPSDYVMSGDWIDSPASVHRTIKWSETARICRRLKDFYSRNESLEILDTAAVRTVIFGQKPCPGAPDKKINMLRRWMVRRDGKVDLGLWTASRTEDLVIPLDVHVYEEAAALGLTSRRARNLATAMEITDAFREIFPTDPCLGDFALFGYGVSKK